MNVYDWKKVFVFWQVFIALGLIITVVFEHWLSLSFAIAASTTLILRAYDTWSEVK